MYFVIFCKCERSTHHLARTNLELFKMNIAPIAKRPMSCFTLERRPAQYFNREICLRNASALMLQPPGLVCNTFPCNLSLSTLFYTLLCNLVILYQIPSNIAVLFPLWKELLRQEDAVEKHMSAQRSRICAIRASGCAVASAVCSVRCAVCEVHCARIDFLWRPSWQIPPPGSRVPRDPLRKLSRNFKGSRLSRPAAAPLRFWMDGHDLKDKNGRWLRW